MGGMISFKKVSFYFDTFYFLLGYYCSINLKKWSEQSGLCLDTSSLIVPTFDTKVTDYLCSAWVFFSSDKFRLFN